MDENFPLVFLLQGDDEYAISQHLKGLEAKYSDPTSAAMNETRLDGRTFNPDELLSVAGAMPFLAKYRIVTLSYATLKYKDKEAHDKFTAMIGKMPATTVLILLEYFPKDSKEYKGHWLAEWAQKARQAEKPVQVHTLMLPKGAQLAQRIQELAKQAGGKITPLAADALAGLIGNDPRLADQEIEKLLAYVNYQRPIEMDDVQVVTADTAEGDIFLLVDALGLQQGPRAMAMLQRLLEREDPMRIFGMVQRQFRLLLQARDVLDRRGGEAEIAKQVRLHPYVAGKILPQARRFKLAELETVFRRLLDLDEGIKTGQFSAELALEMLVAAFTNPQPAPRAAH